MKPAMITKSVRRMPGIVMKNISDGESKTR